MCKIFAVVHRPGISRRKMSFGHPSLENISLATAGDRSCSTCACCTATAGYEQRTKPCPGLPSIADLEAKLLSVGGERVVALPEPHLALLLREGRVFDGPAKRVRG